MEDLPVDNWVRLLSSPALTALREIDITGGEPFIRKDLPDLMDAIIDLRQRHFQDLRGVAITTNGFLTSRILKMTEKMAARLHAEGLDLVLACAMDAVGELHDRTRGVKNGFKKLDASLEGLCDLRSKYPNLILGLKSTVLPQTVDQLEAVADYAGAKGLFTIISPCIITENRYGNLDLRNDFSFSRRDFDRMIDFYQSPRFRWSIHREVLLDYLRFGRVTKPCTAGFNYFFVRSTGEVFPCPLIKYGLGNFLTEPFERILKSRRAGYFRKKITARHTQCLTCTEPGLERYALPCEGFQYAGRLLDMEPEAFQELHTHLGLTKYFD